MLRLFLLMMAFISVFSFQAQAQEFVQFVSVVDAGSTGSRIHVYALHPETNAPLLEEIYKEKVNVPLASFANQPEAAGPALKGLLENAELILRARGASAAPLYIYSTAGMRTLSLESQARINQAVQSYVDSHFTIFHAGGVDVRTISGAEEGLFAWISLNQARQSLGKDTHQTAGIVEMGGASSQIAFAVDYANSNVFSFRINDQDYHVLSLSFLGAGHRAVMEESSEACYPTGAPVRGKMIGQYEYSVCRAAAHQYLDRFHIESQLSMLPQQMHFYGLSAFYFTFSFFEVQNSEQGLDMLQSKSSVCTQSWEDFKKSYPGQKPEYLKEYCFAAAYDYAILIRYGFSSSSNSPKLEMIGEKFQNQSVDWANGVVVLRSFADLVPGPVYP